jgi:hypothetical protein
MNRVRKGGKANCNATMDAELYDQIRHEPIIDQLMIACPSQTWTSQYHAR